ncbi:MAG: hypothetical protein GY927_18190 [bacterium]|nr:hypothetical protein [bacterium]
MIEITDFADGFANKPSGPGYTVKEATGSGNVFSPEKGRVNLFQGHHLIPTKLTSQFSDLLGDLTEYGSYQHRDYASNGVFLPTEDADALRLDLR